MRIVDGIQVPETLGEARNMNFADLQKACETFNKQGVSVEEIEKAWDKHWQEGFDAAIDLVLNTIKNGGFFESVEIANQFADEIIEEVDLYKKDQ